MTDDRVRALLREKGAPDDVVKSGLMGLVAEWERTARQVEEGYPLGLDDYLNDLDGRQLLEEAMGVATEPERDAVAPRVRQADALARAHLETVHECLWGSRVAQSEEWTPQHNWWYFAVPIEPGPMLRDDLEK
jgi:hypothetical protein